MKKNVLFTHMIFIEQIIILLPVTIRFFHAVEYSYNVQS